MKESRLAIRRGKYGHNTVVPNKGVIVEVTVKSNAGYNGTHRVQVVRLTVPGKAPTISATAV